MGYKQPSSGLPFKEIGSSPAKQVKETEYAKALREGVRNKGVAHNNWGREGYNSHTGRPEKNMGLPKNLNTKGSKGSTTPGHSTTKAAKTQNFRNAANKIKTVSSKTNKGSKVIQLLKKGKDTAKNIIKSSTKKLPIVNVVSMLMATSSKADQPVYPKGSTHYRDPKKKIKFGN